IPFCPTFRSNRRLAFVASIVWGEFQLSACGSMSVRFGARDGYALRKRATIARVAGSVASGVLSDGSGTNTFPLTMPRALFCPKDHLKYPVLGMWPLKRPPYWFMREGSTGPD